MKKLSIIFLTIALLISTLPVIAVATTEEDPWAAVDEWHRKYDQYLYTALNPGDLIRVGAADGSVSHLMPSYPNPKNNKTWENYNILFLFAKDYVDVDYIQFDFFAYGDCYEFTAPPVVTYADGTIVEGSLETYADGQRATVIYEPDKGGPCAEVFFRAQNASGKMDTMFIAFYQYTASSTGNDDNTPFYVGHQGDSVAYCAVFEQPPERVVTSDGSVTKFFDFDPVLWTANAWTPDKELDQYSEMSECKTTIWPLPLPGQLAKAESPSSWAVAEVNVALDLGIVPLPMQSKYTLSATRAEFCALATALYEKYTGAEITARRTFDDTKDINVEKMAAVGVVSGVGNNKFDPEAKLTREQAATMLSRLAEALGKPLENKESNFADSTDISTWAILEVGKIQAAGIMSGVGDNTFAPKDPYTREQSIMTMIRLWNAIR